MSPGTTLRPLASAFTAVAAAVLLAAPAGASPVAPEQGPASLAVPEGLEATLFAAEPLLTGPADIDVDARGRVWVVDVLNYRSRTRARAEGDMILVLEDVDGDGRAEKRTVFHQGHDLDGAMGICVLGEGPGRRVIVSCAPEVFVLHDDDGDLVADRREPLFTNSGKPQHDHSLHAFVVGPDGRWYFNVGNTGGTLHDRDGKPVTDRFGIPVTDKGRPYRQGMVFRCRPDGSDFEVLAHNFRNPYEVAVDSFGGLWQSDNDDDGNRSTRLAFVMEHGNFGYVDERTGAGWQVPRTNLEADVPARHWHQNDPGVVPNLAFTGAGAPTGVCVYEGTLLPERFHGAMLACDAGPNLVRACRAIPQGAGYRSELEALVDGKADGWFRPSDVCVAPDGSLLVADWYDPIVGGHGSGDAERGRVYRVAPRGAACRPSTWPRQPEPCRRSRARTSARGRWRSNGSQPSLSRPTRRSPPRSRARQRRLCGPASPGRPACCRAAAPPGPTGSPPMPTRLCGSWPSGFAAAPAATSCRSWPAWQMIRPPRSAARPPSRSMASQAPPPIAPGHNSPTTTRRATGGTWRPWASVVRAPRTRACGMAGWRPGASAWATGGDRPQAGRSCGGAGPQLRLGCCATSSPTHRSTPPRRSLSCGRSTSRMLPPSRPKSAACSAASTPTPPSAPRSFPKSSFGLIRPRSMQPTPRGSRRRPA
jgi:putative membrane-bound dehydrogenase-like protein